MPRDYNQILLTLPNGRQVSIVQGDGIMGKQPTQCEVWVDGEEDPVGYLTVEKLVAYLQQFTKSDVGLSEAN